MKCDIIIKKEWLIAMEYFYLAYEKEKDRIYGSYAFYQNEEVRHYEYINEHLSIQPAEYEDEKGAILNYIEMYKSAAEKIKNMKSFEDAIVLKNEKIGTQHNIIFILPSIYMEFSLMYFGEKMPIVLDGIIYGSFMDEDSNEHGKIFQFLEKEEIENLYQQIKNKEVK